MPQKSRNLHIQIRCYELLNLVFWLGLEEYIRIVDHMVPGSLLVFIVFRKWNSNFRVPKWVNKQFLPLQFRPSIESETLKIPIVWIKLELCTFEGVPIMFPNSHNKNIQILPYMSTARVPERCAVPHAVLSYTLAHQMLSLLPVAAC